LKKVPTKAVTGLLALSLGLTMMPGTALAAGAVEGGASSADGTSASALEEPEPGERPTLTERHVSYCTGRASKTFSPDALLTRAEAAQLVYRLLSDPDGGTGVCAYQDVPAGAWYAEAVQALCAWGLLDDGTQLHPDEGMTRAEFVDLLTRLQPQVQGTAQFSDVSDDYWAAGAIGTAAALGWISGYPDGTFRPEQGLTRAMACTVLNRVTGRTGSHVETTELLTLGLFSDVSAAYWAADDIVEAAVAHGNEAEADAETWNGVDLAALTFVPGFHQVGEQLYYVDRSGKLVTDRTLGAYTADAAGVLTQTATAWQMEDVPYISQIDGLYAWVGCEAVSTLMGLRAKGYAENIAVKDFVDGQPRAASDPEKGFVGSPYVPDTTKKTRTTIYPAKLAEYANTYCGGDVPCADFRGADLTALQRELLAGNCVVGYMTLWWEKPYYRTYQIQGVAQRLVSNNHAVLVCGYDPEKGYFISDPYNQKTPGKAYQYWQNAASFEKIWNERKVGMVIR
jgi:uncharacterized protein YvpB